MRAYERLLNYVKVYTTSEDEQEIVPSTSRQFDLGNQLAKELKSIGVQDVRIDDKCYVYGVIPATAGLEDKPAIGFIAHMDTAPDFSGENVNPQIIPDYDGTDVKLGESEYTLTLKDFPHLADLKGRTLITTDGTTLLGADDKAGVAEIMTMAEQIIKENIPHGKICIGFTPDEEVGRGADFFDVEGFGADFAYTVDGGAENEIEYENFNAAGAKVKIKGFSVHPGSSKNTMINAALVAMEFNSMLPAGDTPANTEEYEGFFHLCEMSGDVSDASLDYIIRDHDSAMFACRQEMMRHIAKLLNEKYGEGIGPDNDQYDFYFCDRENHCIWKLDPHGVASLAAGRSNENADGKIWGYVDGNPLHEARFNQPAGLAYDPDTDMFYIGDIDNKGIRYMTTE